jgi:hypothetical protein
MLKKVKGGGYGRLYRVPGRCVAFSFSFPDAFDVDLVRRGGRAA